MSHIIRLRGPWRYEPISRTIPLDDGSIRTTNVNLPDAGTMQIPGTWHEELGEQFFGAVRFTRNFGKPSRLDSTHEVLLTINDVAHHYVAFLNGEQLGVSSNEDLVFNVTTMLKPRNQLVIVVTVQPGSEHAGLTSVVALEIRENESRR